MLHFSRLKILFISLTILIGLFFFIPNFLNTPSKIFPEKKVVLGLDLQGGSYLLLEVDSKPLFQEKIDTKAFVQKGNTVLVIEHNMDVIKTADWLIDMGPEGGDNGGQILFQGKPEDLIKIKNSYTGEYLEKIISINKSKLKKSA